MPRLTALFARPQNFLALVAGYCLLHGVFRVVVSPSLGRDDLEEAIFAQAWALGYNPRQPPLYTWMLRGLQDLIGEGVVAHTILKFALFFLTLLFLWLAARRLLGGRTRHADTLAALAGASPFLIVTFAWDALQLYTHSMVLAATISAALWALLRLEQPGRTTGDFLLFGAICGLGLLSKYSFPLFLGTLLVAAFADPVLRRALLDLRLLAGLAVMIAIAAPHAWWLVYGPHNVVTDAVVYTLTEKKDLTWAESVGTGLAAFGNAALNFLLVPVLIWLACMPGVFRPAGNTVDDDNRRYRGLLLRFVVLNVLVALAAILFLGFNRVQIHHMISPLLFAPLYAALRAQRLELRGDDLPGRWIQRLAGATVGMVALGAVGLLGKIALEVDAYNCTRCYLHRPLQEIADQLRAEGFRQGTVVTEQQLLAGGIQPFLPAGSRVLTVTYPFYRPAPPVRSDGGQCLLLWDTRRNEDFSKTIAHFVETQLGGTVVLTDPTYLEAPYYFSLGDRTFRVGYVLAPGTGLCR